MLIYDMYWAVCFMIVSSYLAEIVEADFLLDYFPMRLGTLVDLPDCERSSDLAGRLSIHSIILLGCFVDGLLYVTNG